MAKALRLEETCPKCGSHLMIREGESGDFLACPRFPACKFTKPLPDNDLKIYQKPSHPPYCAKCNHTGLIPFKDKKGNLIPHTFLHCDCHEINQPDYYQVARPEDYDFPISYSYYRSLCQYHGWPDPGSCEPPEHNIDEELVMTSEITAKVGVATPKPQEKPSPKLHGGVQL